MIRKLIPRTYVNEPEIMKHKMMAMNYFKNNFTAVSDVTFCYIYWHENTPLLGYSQENLINNNCFGLADAELEEREDEIRHIRTNRPSKQLKNNADDKQRKWPDVGKVVFQSARPPTAARCWIVKISGLFWSHLKHPHPAKFTPSDKGACPETWFHTCIVLREPHFCPICSRSSFSSQKITKNCVMSDQKPSNGCKHVIPAEMVQKLSSQSQIRTTR